jgi:hypothetical protein
MAVRAVLRQRHGGSRRCSSFGLRDAIRVLAALLLCACALGAHADITINIYQVGDTVTARVSGSLDTDVLVFDNGKPPITAGVSPTEGSIQFGAGGSGQIYQSGRTSWDALGPGGFTGFEDATGSLFALLSDGYIALDPNYVSGEPLYATIVRQDSTLSELGFATGDYRYELARQGKSETILVRVGRAPTNEFDIQLVEIGDGVQVTLSARIDFDAGSAGETVNLDPGVRFSGPPQAQALFNQFDLQLGSGNTRLYDFSDDFLIVFPGDGPSAQPWLLDLEDNTGDGFLLQISVGTGSTSSFVIGLPQGYRSGELLRATGIARNTTLAENGITSTSYRFGAASNRLTVTARVDDAPFTVSLEEPVDGQPISGIGNLRGFAFAEDGIEKVEIYIDGEYAFDAPYGGSRTDVGAAFPDIEGSENSGFSLAYGYANLSPGTHTITARAINNEGVYQEDSATFEVLAFDEQFIFANQVVDLGTGSVPSDGDEIYLEDVEIAGKLYSLRLKWRTATQGFEIIEVSR